jgi:hypothetical protein
LIPSPNGTPSAPESCSALLAHGAEGCPAGAAHDLLSAALSNTDEKLRDAGLACLENAPDFPAGLVRALRAELARRECADVVALPFVEANLEKLERPLADALIALSIAGRLTRLVRQAPVLPPPFDKAQFMAFFTSTLQPWVVAQASAIQALAVPGPRLSPYAKGVVAVESGLADMRFVSVVRDVPLPEEMKSDAEVRDAYYIALDEALEPRKTRGRDAALVGLRELAELGITHDARVDEARALLSQLFSGRRINALDPLLLPELAALPQPTTEQRLAALLPTFYANRLLGEVALDEPILRAFLEQGLPSRIEQRLKTSKLGDVGYELYARALVERGQRYFRAADFRDARAVAAQAGRPTDALSLYGALGHALELGYSDPTEILSGKLLEERQIQIADLDRIAARRGPLTGLAAFDAAFLLTLPARSNATSPTAANDRAFGNDLVARFARAERTLPAPLKATAREYGEAARQTQKAMQAIARPAAKP